MLFLAIFILFFNKSIKIEPMEFFLLLLFCFAELGDKEDGASVEVWFITTLLLESVFFPLLSSESLLLLSFLTSGFGFCCLFYLPRLLLGAGTVTECRREVRAPMRPPFHIKAHLLGAMFCLGVERIPGHVTDVASVLLEPKVRGERKK